MRELSHIPSDWETASVSSVADVIDPHPSHRAPVEEVSGIPFAGIGDLDEAGNIRESKVRRVSPEIYDEHYKRYRITNNTIGFGRVASIGKIIAFKGFSTKITISPTIAIIEPHRIGKDFLVQALKSEDTAAQIKLLLTGSTRSSLGIALLRDLIIPYPPLPEQQKIATILSSVDDVIEKTRAQIDKLKDLKTGMMQELLTKGIGHTEFKDSPVGRMPAAWKIASLEDLCIKVSVGIASSTTHAYSDKGVPLLRNQNILPNKIRLTDVLYITEAFSEENASKKLHTGDVLTVRTGYPGISAVVPEEFNGCHSFTTLISRPKHDILNPNYLALLINSDYGKKFVVGGQAGGAQQNLNATTLKIFPVILPPLDEQVAIYDAVNSFSQKISLTQKKLSLMSATKKALMQDLLTGKVRVKLTDKKSAAR